MSSSGAERNVWYKAKERELKEWEREGQKSMTEAQSLMNLAETTMLQV